MFAKRCSCASATSDRPQITQITQIDRFIWLLLEYEVVYQHHAMMRRALIAIGADADGG
jgi:hypothetical protein